MLREEGEGGGGWEEEGGGGREGEGGGGRRRGEEEGGGGRGEEGKEKRRDCLQNSFLTVCDINIVRCLMLASLINKL